VRRAAPDLLLARLDAGHRPRAGWTRGRRSPQALSGSQEVDDSVAILGDGKQFLQTKCGGRHFC
jgi:hypothetical protein